MTKNLVSGLILATLTQIWVLKFFSGILSLIDVIHYCRLSLHAISIAISNEPNLMLAHLAKFRLPIFQRNIWLRQSLDIIVSYHRVQYQKKLMIQSWENLRTDRSIHHIIFIKAEDMTSSKILFSYNGCSFLFLMFSNSMSSDLISFFALLFLTFTTFLIAQWFSSIPFQPLQSCFFFLDEVTWIL